MPPYPMMDRRIPELVLLLILAVASAIIALVLGQWLFCAIFWIEAMRAVFMWPFCSSPIEGRPVVSRNADESKR